MSATFLPPGEQTFVDINGKPLVGGQLFHYIPGTDTFKDTWQDFDQTIFNTNPVTLDARGQCILWGDGFYRQVLKDAAGNTIWDRECGFGNASSSNIFASVAEAAAASIAVSVQDTGLIVNGYYAAGDGGDGLYRYHVGVPPHPAYFRSTDGAYWELVADPVRFAQLGAVPDGATDCTAAINNTLAYAFYKSVHVECGHGTFLCLGDVNVPVGDGAPDIAGEGWAGGTQIKFSGGGCPHGLYFNGNPATFPKAGTLRNLRITCTGGAVRGATLYGVNHPRLERAWIDGAAGNGALFDYALMGRLEHCLFTNCGSAALLPLEIDHSTTFLWNQSRISGVRAGTPAAVAVDRSNNIQFSGGNIETAGVPFRICSKVENATPVQGMRIRDMDLEHPADSYFEIGYGWTGTVGLGVLGLTIRDCVGFPSGAAAITYGAKIKNTIGLEIDHVQLGLVGAPVACWLFEGTNYGQVVRSQRESFGNNVPWVMEGGVQRNDASPIADWVTDSPIGINQALIIAGATPDCRFFSAQGGISRALYTNNGAPVTVTALTGCAQGGLRITFFAQDGNTTIKHGIAVAGFFNRSGADRLLSAGGTYSYVWVGNAGGFWSED